MQLISTILNAFCQNLILFFYEILKDIIYTSILDIVFLNKLKIFYKIIGLYFIFIKRTYWIDLSLLIKMEKVFMIINLLLILRQIIGLVIGNPITIIITIFSIFIELIKLFGKI